jgi:3-methyl-2-oxobutanoate hydroxymethyltransferase
MEKITVKKITQMKKIGEKIAALTCYHAAQAKLLNQAGIDIVLVGDSLNMVLLGNDDTLSATLDLMVLFTKAVKKNTKTALLVGDMPYNTFGVSIDDTLRNAGRFIEEGGADAVKLEGAGPIIDHINVLVKNNIPVMGHIGLTPQSCRQLGGFRVQGKTMESAQKIKKEALMLQDAGAFSVVLECVPVELAKEITQSLLIPTIGIGAGKYCDGQVLVIDDMLGMDPDLKIKFVKRYAHLSETIPQAVKQYIKEIKDSSFPDEEHSY